MIYLDTSALIKRFVEETGSAEVEKLILEQAPASTATLAYVEVYSGLSRKRRDDELTGSQFDEIRAQFEDDWPSYVRVHLRDDVLHLARDLVRRHPLRALDAVHVASALQLQSLLDAQVTFVAADRRVLDAARAEGMDIIDSVAGGRDA